MLNAIKVLENSTFARLIERDEALAPYASRAIATLKTVAQKITDAHARLRPGAALDEAVSSALKKATEARERLADGRILDQRAARIEAIIVSYWNAVEVDPSLAQDVRRRLAELSPLERDSLVRRSVDPVTIKSAAMMPAELNFVTTFAINTAKRAAWAAANPAVAEELNQIEKFRANLGILTESMDHILRQIRSGAGVGNEPSFVRL